ncbi:MAG: bifunctional [glutamate--ammonia ligase]-adenylyl-L-tyrosine phosphorylase/[glutamate--ammonia-ligase] adenylyltransferase [Burkholderiales bacterium]|nr:bifunctional [glutamate--ammonia ligase]-adenylyl-L-tyrosine phosphorylase/[glutamate--ammonia-ligase] adenylyltransferase [Burkholderiales bacterium]
MPRPPKTTAANQSKRKPGSTNKGNKENKATPDAAMQRALALSRYVQRTLSTRPDLVEASGAAFSRDQMRALLPENVGDEAALFQSLRELRKRVMLRVIARDLGGLCDLAEVVATVTTLAEVAISYALSHLHNWAADQYGQPKSADGDAVQQLHVVGMGKLGGGELNVSSDIDLIFVYPEDGATVQNSRSSFERSIDHHEFFTRVGRKLIAALGEVTASSFVFRVDMRLRPYGESSPLATSFAALENYFITQGREWERYAWLKARALTGDQSDALMQLVRPFVFRRHLDFSALAAMRDLHAQIRRDVGKRGHADNIKLGPGGIREIEFVAQVFQLIRGGREAELRVRPTLQALANLGARNYLPTSAVSDLRDAYVFLRNLEHRLQYLDDQQTQTLPANDDDRALIAEAMGFADYQALLKQLDQHRANVSREFDQVFSPTAEATTQTAKGDGGAAPGPRYSDSDAARQRIEEFRASSRYRQMPATGNARMEALLPRAANAAAAFDDPDTAFARLLNLLESISRRESYLAFLLEYPHALERVAKLASASAWASEYLTQHPILMDELLDSRPLALPDWTALRQSLARQLDDAEGDTETQMDLLRHFKHSQTFRLLVADLAGELRLEKLSDDLSALADLCLAEALRVCWTKLATAHRSKPKFAVIGYGKLGGKELGYASDLDIIFLFDDDAPGAPENYARLGQRINTWLNSATAAGVLYDTDLRLRPNGQSGLLVSNMEAFSEYQTRQAWTWEHQALTRARLTAGDAKVGRQFEKIREQVLRQARDLDQLRADIVAMREKMLDAHPNQSALFDVKHDRGGIIDVEFIVQYLVLGHARTHSKLTANIGNLALLRLAAELKLIPAELAQQSHDAYRHFRRLQHALRLQNERYARVAADSVSAHVEAVRALWRRVFDED